MGDSTLLSVEQIWTLYWVILIKMSLQLLHQFRTKIWKLIISSFNKIGQCPTYKWWGDEFSSRKCEELLLILVDRKKTFEDHLLNNVQKINQKIQILARITAQKMTFSIKDFFSKCDQGCSHLLKKSLMENFIFCAVNIKDHASKEAEN